MKLPFLQSTYLACALLLSFAVQADLQKGINAANFGDFQTAEQEFLALIEQNYAPGMYHLAELYAKGLGRIKDDKKALELYQQAADMQMPKAEFMLGVIYKEGRGVETDLSQAAHYFTLAAKKGLTMGQFNLAVMYANGEGVKQDHHLALKWYHEAAANNLSVAQFNIALMYYEGLGTDKNIQTSFVWNSIAALNGHAGAIKSLAIDKQKLSAEEIKDAKKRIAVLAQQINEGTYIPPVRF